MEHNQTSLSYNLGARGFINQFSGESLEEILDKETRTFYLGVDPTADSLHVGNLAVYMLARQLIDYGHKPILLVGGGTALLGDPKDTLERQLSDESEVKMRAEKLYQQVKNLLGVEAEIVNNYDWLHQLNLIDFLRKFGKHLTVNQMIKKDIIARRLVNESPISYTEFAYAPLQGYDFWHLFKTKNCSVQIGGSDQWGNLMTGVELIKKLEGKTAYALTSPLIIDKASGRKFGKSEGNAVWLDKNMTSPYGFYQFWLNVSDEEVVDRLKIFTLLPLEKIEALAQEVKLNPQQRTSQKTLAYEVTKFIHGENLAVSARAVSEVLFGEVDFSELTDGDILMLKEEAPIQSVKIEDNLIEILIAGSLAASKGEARRLIEAGGITLNDKKITAVNFKLTVDDFNSATGLALLRRGKKQLLVLVLK